MKNKKTFGMMSLVLLTALSGCNKDDRTKVQFWTGFGTGINKVLQDDLLKRFEEKNPDVKVEYTTKGGYPNLMQAMTSSISNNAYPHIANGYPDHFATYANSQIVIDLNTTSYIKNPNPEVGVDIEQYLPNYMNENLELIPGAITGLPFNKSTEVMVANQSFFDVATKLDPTVKVPETWQELRTQGEKIKLLAKNNGWFGKLVKHDGTTLVKPEKPTPAQIAELVPLVAFDFTTVKEEEFIPFSWDSTANFFITIVRQWDAQFTEQGATFQSGKMVFHKEPNMAKTVAALKYFQDLYKDKIVGLPITYGESSFSSKPFKEGKLVLTISSSAGADENIPVGTTDFPFEVSVNKIPYNEDHPDLKYVISQGTNLALFTRGKIADEKTRKERNAAWRLLRYLTYEVNHEFGMRTSYYPVTDGTMLAEDESNPRYQDYKLYKEFLNADEVDATEKAIRDAARVQADGYQEKDAEGEQLWIQFVDPGFIGSARIRDEVSFVMGQIFADGLTPELAIKGVVDKLPLYA